MNYISKQFYGMPVSHWILCLAYSMIINGLVTLVFKASLLIMIPLILISLFFSRKLFQRKIADLDNKIQNLNNTFLTVFINQVEVGIISVSDFAKIEKSVFLDSTTCLLQLLTLPKAIFRILNSAIPVFTTSFVLIILLGITFAPSEFLSGVHALLKMTPDQLQVFAYMVWWLFITIFIMAYLLSIVFSKSFSGFENVFKNEIFMKVRQIMEIQADGEISLIHQPTNDHTETFA